MVDFIDLSHDFEDGMPGFRMKNEDGTITSYSASIKPFLTHQQTLPKFNGHAAFEITEMTFQTSIGTYLDSPYHRYSHMRDISQIKLEEVILNGEVLDARKRNKSEAVGLEILKDIDLTGKGVLINFGWDQFWGSEQYNNYPFISNELIDELINRKIKLIGVDTINIDNSRDLTRPAHSKFLEKDILIVENLMNIDKLYNKRFRFFAVPIKGKKVAAMPIRAFAEILE
ncbi:MAG: cyclase family protein [Candidatus Hodarchaeales archaeon]|jgi:kynurenine formamidase